MIPATDEASAKRCALRLIKFRPRSEQEVRDKLKLKDFDPATIDQVVGSLKNSRIIDDALFAKLWIQGRIKKPLGFSRLRLELRQKGVEGRVIEEALKAARAGYDEETVIRGIVQSKAVRLKGLPEDKMKARIFGYLVRRGFSRERVVETLMEELGQGD